ncbi:MAG: UDP-N-acetylglucosamine diphosphorylase/glucosamine-1-phosphate N-acetyltransferase, partial [Gammaproteobacteria bacterium]|nr:UDP-N-acetylglucosamine diphosphorylase/glucosamine-1-phosphate N-acetyltransferase [Gammaproteobacteria bacterium]
ELVAPIRVGKDVTIGAGSTLSKDIDDGVLVVERSKARTIKDWQRPKKK